MFIQPSFRQAVHSNSYDKVRQALNTRRKYDLEQPDAQGMTLVMVAAYFGMLMHQIHVKKYKNNRIARNSPGKMLYTSSQKWHLLGNSVMETIHIID